MLLNIIKGILTALGIAAPLIQKLEPVIVADLEAGKSIGEIVRDVLAALVPTTTVASSVEKYQNAAC